MTSQDELEAMGIKGNENTVLNIDKQKYCPSCGSKIERNSTICYHCGVNPQKVNKKKFCPYCGQPVNEEQVICLHCKEDITTTNFDVASGGMLLLCFLFPIIGLCIYIANNNTRKQYAKDCGLASLWGFIIGIIVVCIALFANI